MGSFAAAGFGWAGIGPFGNRVVGWGRDDGIADDWEGKGLGWRWGFA